MLIQGGSGHIRVGLSPPFFMGSKNSALIAGYHESLTIALIRQALFWARIFPPSMLA
jgi:hypothetical protein